MAWTLDKLDKITAEENVRYLAQQDKSALRHIVDWRHGPSSEHTFEIMGKWDDFALKTARTPANPPNVSGRLVPTPFKDVAVSKRVAVPAVRDTGSATEQEDVHEMITDPASKFTHQMAASFNRGLDSMIITALTGTALDDAGTDNDLPAAQIIGDGTKEFNFGFVTKVTKKFLVNDIPRNAPKLAIIGPEQAELLMYEEKATNGDFGMARTLVEGGFLERWMGYTWVVHNDLTAPATGVLDCIFTTYQALGGLMLQDLYFKGMEDPTKSFAKVIYAAFNAGVVRVEDAQVVVARVLNSATVSGYETETAAG